MSTSLDPDQATKSRHLRDEMYFDRVVLRIPMTSQTIFHYKLP